MALEPLEKGYTLWLWNLQRKYIYIMALEPLEKGYTLWLWNLQRKDIYYGFGTFREIGNYRNFTFIKKSNKKIRQEIIGENVKNNTLNIKLINNKIRQYGQRGQRVRPR